MLREPGLGLDYFTTNQAQGDAARTDPETSVTRQRYRPFSRSPGSTSVSVDVTGAKTLELLVDYADRADQQDHANWLDARLVRRRNYE